MTQKLILTFIQKLFSYIKKSLKMFHRKIHIEELFQILRKNSRTDSTLTLIKIKTVYYNFDNVL